jgi:hypothetical protein
VQELAIATPRPGRPLKFLSGGNQQKVLIAKWLSTNARIFIFDEPAVGVDIGAKRGDCSLIAGLAGHRRRRDRDLVRGGGDRRPLPAGDRAARGRLAASCAARRSPRAAILDPFFAA